MVISLLLEVIPGFLSHSRAQESVLIRITQCVRVHTVSSPPLALMYTNVLHLPLGRPVWIISSESHPSIHPILTTV